MAMGTDLVSSRAWEVLSHHSLGKPEVMLEDTSLSPATATYGAIQFTLLKVLSIPKSQMFCLCFASCRKCY